MSNLSPEQSPSLFDVASAARSNAVVFNVSDRTQIEVTGADRARFLHSFTSNDIKRLKPGESCETFVTNLKGKVVAHVLVFCSEQSLLLDGAPGQQDAIIKHLAKYVLIDDVQLIPRGADRIELFIAGPAAEQLLPLIYSSLSNVVNETSELRLDTRRADLLGQPGFLLSMPKSNSAGMPIDVADLKSILPPGIVWGSREQFEALRIEAGYPLYGVDITEDNLAQEVGRTKQCISFDKGCYLGQETIARLDSLGHTNRELRRLSFEMSEVPVAGTLIYDATGTTEVGAITSAAPDPNGVAPGDSTSAATSSESGQQVSVVALGMLKRGALDRGTVVKLVMNDPQVPGRVR